MRELLFLLSLSLPAVARAQITGPWNETWYWPQKSDNPTGYGCSVNETDNTVQCNASPDAFCLSMNPNDVDYCCTDKCSHYPTLQPDYGGTVPCGGSYCSSEAECVDSLCQVSLANATTKSMLDRIAVPFLPVKNHKPAVISSASPSSPTGNSTSPSSPNTTSSSSSSSNPTTTSTPEKKSNTAMIAGIAAGVAVLIIGVIAGCCVYQRRGKSGGGGGQGGYMSTNAPDGGPAEMHAESSYGPKPSYVELESKPGTPANGKGAGWNDPPLTPNIYGQSPGGNVYELHGSGEGKGGKGGYVHEMP